MVGERLARLVGRDVSALRVYTDRGWRYLQRARLTVAIGFGLMILIWLAGVVGLA